MNFQHGTNRTATARNATFALLAVAFITLVLPSIATAAAAGGAAGGAGAMPYEPWLLSLRNSMTGPVALTLSLVGFVVAGGVLMFGGEINAFARTFIFIILVMCLLVGANNLLTTVFNQGSEIGDTRVEHSRSEPVAQ